MSPTLITVHDYIVKNWEQLEDGDVIEVEFILGEIHVKKVSEQIDHD